MLANLAAFNWVFWRRHGMSSCIAAAYLVFGGAMAALLTRYCDPETAQTVIGLYLMPFSGIAVLCLVIFTYGMDGTDVLGRESGFPARLLRLPVNTAGLVVWPIVFGAAAFAGLWFAMAGLLLRPMVELDGKSLPLMWPALAATASLAWLQALLWAPFGLRWLRVVLLGALVPAIGVLIGTSLDSLRSETFLAGQFGGLTLLGWILGYAGVRQTRRGRAPDWQRILNPVRHLAGWLPKRRLAFISAAQAQAWFETRLSGKSLPIMTAMVLPVALWPLALGQNDVISTAQVLLGALAVPIIMAGLFGAQGGGNYPGVAGHHGFGPFNATLPITSAAMVGAILKACMRSTLVSWLLIAILIPSAVVVTGRTEEVAGWWRQAIGEHHPAKVVIGLIAATAVLVVWTWKRQVDRLYFFITGRPWVCFFVAWLAYPSFILACYGIHWLYGRPATHDLVVEGLPWLLSFVIVGRLATAGLALRRSVGKGLLTLRTIAGWVAGWLVLAALLFGTLVGTTPREWASPSHLALGVLFAMPIARMAAAPLALAWNRHR